MEFLHNEAKNCRRTAEKWQRYTEMAEKNQQPILDAVNKFDWPEGFSLNVDAHVDIICIKIIATTRGKLTEDEIRLAKKSFRSLMKAPKIIRSFDSHMGDFIWRQEGEDSKIEGVDVMISASLILSSDSNCTVTKGTREVTMYKSSCSNGESDEES